MINISTHMCNIITNEVVVCSGADTDLVEIEDSLVGNYANYLVEDTQGTLNQELMLHQEKRH